MKSHFPHKGRSRLHILLDVREYDNLAAAVLESGMNRSFLVFKAVEHGVRILDMKCAQGQRFNSIYVWIPTILKNELIHLSTDTKYTQQSLLRLFLSQYLNVAPWRTSGG